MPFVIKKSIPYTFSLIIVLSFAGFIACKTSKHSSTHLPGTWQAQPIVVDGYNNDWPSPYPEYDEKALLGYAVSNDSKNLYITIETGDPATQLKILHNGLTIWLDKTGGRNAVTAINFPLQDEYKSKKSDDAQKTQLEKWQEKQHNRPEDRRYALEDRVKKALDYINEFSLQGFKGCNAQFSILETDSCGIKTRIALDSTNELVWEAIIPFKAFYYKPEITRADKGKPMTIAIETTGMKRPPNQGGNGGNRGGGGGGIRPSIGFGGGGGMMMGMGGGGMRRGSGGNSKEQDPSANIMEPLYKDTKTIKRFGIAWQ
jgi:uncharacterized membrane protein YgcG